MKKQILLLIVLITGCAPLQTQIESDIHGCYARHGNVLISGEMAEIITNNNQSTEDECCCCTRELTYTTCICKCKKDLKTLFIN